MLLYAQHGHAPADKLASAVAQGFIDGVILSARYLTPDNAGRLIEDLREIRGDIHILFDPEFYATKAIGAPNAQLGNLELWPYFLQRSRNALLVGTSAVDEILRLTFSAQRQLDCSFFIAPSIFISNSFDSMDAVIELSFATRAKYIAADMGITKPVFVTLAFCKDALLDRYAFRNYLNLLTALEPLPDGAYILIGTGPADSSIGASRSELLAPEVIGGWMALNYALELNGIHTINGCSDIFSPLLGIANGTAAATGWWSNLQVFAMSRYIRGGSFRQPPLIRYPSKRIMNRLTLEEREILSEISPEIMNGLSTDAYYLGRVPNRTEEALQLWQSLGSLCGDLISGNINEDLARFSAQVQQARQTHADLLSHGISQNYETNMDYLRVLDEGVRVFREITELPEG